MNKLLILGATYNEIDIIKCARNKGIYTIVTDNNLDWSKSPAKYIADEAWNISWSDIDTLYKKSIDNNVNGVIAGFSEFRVENMIKLCTRLGLPCALSMEQLNITRDKIRFKKLCTEYGIQGVPEYKYGDNIRFPVIVKPVDRAGSIGINVVYTKDEFENAYKIAYDLSSSKNVIIEDFIEDGIKVDFYYYVKNNIVTLLGTSDTIMCEGDIGAPILQKAWLFPSKFQAQYIQSIDSKVRRMILGIGIKDGYITMSAFYRNNKFYFFEAGFRLSGELSYNYYKYIAGVNYVDTIIDYALGIANSDIYVDCYRLNKYAKSVILNFFALDGCVKEMQLPDFKENYDLDVIPYYFIKIGDVVRNDTKILKKASMYTLFSSKEDVLEQAVKYVNDNMSITDTNGAELIYEKVDEKSLGYSSIYEFTTHQEKNIKLMYKPYWITWNDIQNVLNKAHETNVSQGLIYATYNQSVSRLKEKTKNSICLVAFVNDVLAATGTVQFRSINHWYHSGEIGLLKLLGVIPEYRGYKLASLLTKTILFLSENKPVYIVVSDSAENNVAIKNLYLSEGFKIVDCCKYPNNNFVSTVYAKWLTDIPYSQDLIEEKYTERRKLL